MNVINYRLSLDMFDTSSQTTIKAKKGDTACKINITLTENGKIYKIAEGCYAIFSAKKADNTFIYDKCDVYENCIIYEFLSSVSENGVCQITACAGITECEVTLYSEDGDQLTSPRFMLLVDNTVYNGEKIISSSEANALKGLIDDANRAISEASKTVADIKEKADNGDFNGADGKDAVTDQSYDSKSPNAQSGVALDPVLAKKQDLFGTVEQPYANDNVINLEKAYTYFKADDNNFVEIGTDGVIVHGKRVIVSNGQLSGNLNALENKIIGLGAPEADTDAANKGYVDAKTSWKTLLDVTLTEEQGGVASLMLAIDDAEALANAKRLRLFAYLPVAKAYAANKFYTTMVIRDADNTCYNSTMLAGYNVAGGENVKYFVMANVDISDIGFVSGNFTRTYHSIAVFPTPWYGVPANNNVSTKHIAGSYPAEHIKKYQPYFELKVTTPDTVTFEEGTRIVLEVQ